MLVIKKNLTVEVQNVNYYYYYYYYTTAKSQRIKQDRTFFKVKLYSEE